MSEQIFPVVMPKLGLSMTEGVVAQWHVEEGHRVACGDVIADIETSKITNALEAHDAGVVRKIVVQAADSVPVGALLSVIADEAVPDTDLEQFIASFVPSDDAAAAAPDATAAEPAPPAAAQQDGNAAPAAARPQERTAAPATRLAEKLASKHGVDLRDVVGTGKNGRISRTDVENHIATSGAAPAPDVATPDAAAPAAAAYEEAPLTPMRRVIAARLSASKQNAPHFRLTMDINAEQLLMLRSELNYAAAEVKVSINDLLVKAIAHALMQLPEVNIQFDGELVRRFPGADVAVAVALDDGLVTPVVRAAEKKSITDISETLAALIARARRGALTPGEIEGGTFTLSNLGMFGIKAFDAIINPPQAAILAVGAVEKRRIFSGDDELVARIITATASFDHRVIDGATGARFMQALKQFTEAPREALL